MSMVIDSRQTYFDADGVRLSGGRLRFYVWGTTTPATPATVYSDIDHQTPIEGAIQLTSAGWTPFEVFSTQDLDVRADKFIGLDEYGLERYQEVKSFRYIPGGTGAAGGDTVGMAIVESIADLRALSTSFDSATVLGYYVAGDCPARTYNVKTSAATENGGTIINSTVDPSKKWEWTPDCAEIDCRTFGVIESASTTVNSQVASYLGYCEMRGATAKFVGGTYHLTPGSLASAAALSAAAGTLLSCPGGTYTLTLSNPALRIVDTFAGEGLDLLLTGGGWEQTVVPVSAFRNGTHCQGAAHYILRLNSNNTTFATGFQYAGVVVDEALVVGVTVSPGVEINTPTISGLGKIAYQTSDTFYVDYLHTSRLSGREGYAMDRTLKVVYVETDITMPPGIDISASIIDAGGSITCGPMTQGGSITVLRGAIDCRPGFLRGTVGFKLFGTIDVQKFDSAELAVKTWVFSEESYPELNMRGITATFDITRSGTIRNGTIVGKLDTDYLRLYDVSQNGTITLNSLIAEGCEFTCNSYNVGGGSLKRCALSHTSSTAPAPYFQNHVLEDFTTDYPYLRVLGGGAVWRNVNCNHVRLIPGNSFGNFDWVGGSAVSVTFDASVATANGTFTAYNVTITQLKNLSGGISSVNGSTKMWASSGHYNIRIGDNEGGKRTYGSCDVSITHTGSYYGSNWRAYIGYLNKLFYFNAGETSLVAWSARAYKAAELGCHFETMTETTVDRTKNGEFHLWTQRFNTLEGKQPDHAHITFEVYY